MVLDRKPGGYWHYIAAVAGLILAGQCEQGWAKDKGHPNQQQSAQPFLVEQARPPSAGSAQEQCYPDSEPGIACNGIAAKAAVDQARDADQQAAAVWWQFRVGVGTLLAAIAAAFFAWRAAHHTMRSANIAEDAQRPWIAIREVKIYRDIDNFGGGATPIILIEIEFIVENVGNVPARDFGISYKFVGESDAVSVIDGLIVDFQSAIAGSVDGKRLAGKVVFPGAKETISGDFRFAVDPAMKTVDGGFVFFDPLLVGVFFYRGPHSKSVRYTTFAYKIGYTGGHWPVIPSHYPRPPFSKDNIHLMKWPWGWLAA